MATYSVPLGRSLNRQFVRNVLIGISIFLAVAFITVFAYIYYRERRLPAEHSTDRYKNCPKTRDGFLNVHILCHTHNDISWLKTFDQYYYGTNSQVQNVAVQYILETVVDELKKNEERRFVYVETAFFWRWWKEQTEETKEDVRQLVDRGQLEFAGGGWSMNDEATPSYQQIIESFTLGLRKLDDLFGEKGRPKVGWQIDPFGASREQASLFAHFGFDGAFVNRIDIHEKAIRLKNKIAEFIWQGSPNLGGTSDLFTNCMYDHYQTLDGLDFESKCKNDAIVDDKDSPEYNVDEKATRIIEGANLRSKFYESNNVYLTFGDDFTYNNAISWFKSLDKLIKYINSNEVFKTHVFYSTPSCYIKSVNDAKLNLTTKSDDFFPYRRDDNSFWTGFYTSRPNFKYLIRFANNALQVMKQLCALTGYSEENDSPLDLLKAEMGMTNHHDTITGTSVQEVVKDNIRRLTKAIASSAPVTESSIKKLLAKSETISDINFEACLHLNISQCAVCETSYPFVVTLYNPLSHPVNHYVRVPVYNDLFYSVLNSEGEKVPAQLIPLPKPVLEIPGRLSKSKVELVFKAEDLPAFGFKSYYIAPSNDVMETTREIKADTYTIGKLENVALVVDAKSGTIKNVFRDGLSYDLSQKFLYYSSYRRPRKGINSGAYVFNPETNTPKYIKTSTNVEGYSGAIVEEIHQTISDWISQVIRIYKDENYVEFEWLVGPLDVEKKFEGKEVISVYKIPSLKSKETFFTDSNGREMMRRVRNQRPTWKVNLEDNYVAGNYYPVTSRIMIQDEQLQLAVLPDRPEGGSSLHDGEIELMIHRNLPHDDNAGMEEPLIETEFGKEVVVRGKHFLTLGSPANQSAVERILAKKRFNPVMTFVTPAKDIKFSKWNQLFKMEYSGLKFPLPENVQILTLEPWKEGELLLRLEHLMENTDHVELSKPVTIDLKTHVSIIRNKNILCFLLDMDSEGDKSWSEIKNSSTDDNSNFDNIFSTFKIRTLKEMTLDGNLELKHMHRLQWNVLESARIENRKKNVHDEAELTAMKIVLYPMEIRTFIIEMAN